MKMQGFENIANAHSEKVLQWVKNERTAGLIPSWDSSETGKGSLEKKLGFAVGGVQSSEFTDALSYQKANDPVRMQEKAFGFRDLVDMINPLQHIPLVNLAYRQITGDEIKPIGKIIGGAMFGGPMGATSGIIDVIIKQETGKDMAGNALSFVEQGPAEKKKEDLSIALLDQPAMTFPKEDSAKTAAQAYDRVQFVESRTAGTMVRYS